MNEQICILGLGSNLGDRMKSLRDAVSLLQQAEMRLLKCSSIYETEPWGMKEQPVFLNCALEMNTTESIERVFRSCKKIENLLGRTEAPKYFPRMIDIDILFFGTSGATSGDVVVPHPQLHKRRFVLMPLLEIIPEFLHPVFKRTVRELLDECPDTSLVTKTNYTLGQS